MRLRPFTPNAPIPDIEEDPNPFFADINASENQELFNNHIPQIIHFQLTPETVEREKIDTEHGIIYYGHAQRSKYRTPLQPIPENSLQTFQQPLEDLVVSTNKNDEHRVEPDEAAIDNTKLIRNSNRTQVTSCNNSTRYNLWPEPKPKTYRDFIVHELQVKPALL